MVQQPIRSGYAIFRSYLFQSTVPACYDETDFPVIYATELEAQREIADNQLTRIRGFLDSERDCADAIAIDEFVLPVNVWPDRRVSTKDGRLFGKLD